MAYWWIPIDGRPMRQLETDPPTTGGIRFSVNPDGKHVVFGTMSSRPAQDVWVLENFLPGSSAKR